jgi:hypothetical protein
MGPAGFTAPSRRFHAGCGTISDMTRVGMLAVTAFACFGAAVMLYTYDVHVPITGSGAPDDSFCGSAYDVVFLKKDGYMGGEMPPNQDRIDAACISRSKKFVGASFAAAGLGLVLLMPLGLSLRARRRATVPRHDGPPAALR